MRLGPLQLGVALLGLALLGPLFPAGGAAMAQGRADRRLPSVGYVYPAGGRQGTVVTVRLGGQNLRGARVAHVSGEGVSATVLRHLRTLNNQQQRELRRRIAEVRARREAAEAADREPRKRLRKSGKTAQKTEDEPRPKLPAHPLLDRLDELSEAELETVAVRFLGVERRKQQPNAQIAETVEVELEVAPGAAAGYREIRLETRSGLSNPIRFQVGDLPEVLEVGTASERTQILPATPVTVNGQILPGEVDRFRFRAQRGRRIVLAAAARELVPFLADAVPGWFQAVLCVRDASGRECAFGDDFGFEPDPRIVFDVPADGEYVVEIRDSIYRGREDFVYRLSIAEHVPLTWSERPTATPGERPRSEAEPNDDPAHAEGLLLPAAVLGRISRPGDEDFYVFPGRADDEVVVELEGRRLGSPIDALVRLLDSSGAVLGWNDDFDDGEPGLLTHHADCYLRLRLPADGAYTLQVADVRGHGSVRHGYRLRVGAPQPDFALAVTPSSLTVPAGGSVPFRVHVLRRDGFDGEIDLGLVDSPRGFVLSGGRVPAGSSSLRMTVTAPPGRGQPAGVLQLEGRARIATHDVRRRAVPTDDRMQAFLYRHLVPAQEWLVSVTGGRGARPPVTLVSDSPVRVAPGSTVRVEARVPGLAAGTPLRARLDQPPDWITLAGTEVVKGSIVLLLRATEPPADASPDNLIVEILALDPRRGAVHAGYLPAIRVALRAQPVSPD